MIELDDIVPSLAILYRLGPGGFEHLATAWSVADGEWVTSTSLAFDPDWRLMSVLDGSCAAVEEPEREGQVLGLRSSLSAGRHLELATGEELAKRRPCLAFGYPDVIDHPAINLHRGSLDPERYLPYLCSWRIDGHCTCFGREDGFLAGRAYPGMNGGPVCGADGRVLGLLAEPGPDPGDPPMAAFVRCI